jgi:uncharacterized protein
MRLPSFWIRVIGLGLVLVLGLWLVNSIYSLYISVALTAPWLANILLASIITLLLGSIGLLIYYGGVLNQGLNHKKSKPKPVVPADRQSAAQVNLAATNQQVLQIQDEVARTALAARAAAITESWQRGPIRVIIFGTGSVGKTSLINVLTGQIVGAVGAVMGTTAGSKEYALNLRGLERQILLIDTPGILEAGLAGTERGRIAREEAAAAAMILFVVDNDLRQSELEPLQALAAVGKRSILVFNKADLYPAADRMTILGQLRSRVAPVIPPDDVVAVMASPRSVQLPNGQTFQPEPDINDFLQRFADILRSTGEDLVAENILQQSQQLSGAAQELIDEERRRQADKIVDKYQWISAGAIAINPLPMVDLIATAAINGQMIIDIGQVYGCQLDRETAKELALSLGKTLAGLGILKGAIQLVTTALKVTVATYILGKAIQGVTGAYLTRIAGKSFIEYFRRNQDWGDGGITAVVQEQFQLAQQDEFVKLFLQEAVGRVVKPLQQRPKVE